MALQLATNFDLNAQLALDSRTVVSNITQRNNLVTSGIAYQGIVVYVTSENKYYYYNTSNQWTELVTTATVGSTGATGATGPSTIKFTLINSGGSINKNSKYAVDTSVGSFNIVLPFDPSIGDTVEIIDYKETFDVNNLIITSFNHKIEGIALSEEFICNVKGAHFILIFIGGDVGWRVSIIDNNLYNANVYVPNNRSIPLLYLQIDGTGELFDSLDSYNFKIPWNKVEWMDTNFVATGTGLNPTKIINYNPINKNIAIIKSGIYSVDLRFASYNLTDPGDFLRARLRVGNSPLLGGTITPPGTALAGNALQEPQSPICPTCTGYKVLASFAQGPIGTSFNGEGMQAGFTTFRITGNGVTYITADFIHFGANNISQGNQPWGYPVFNNTLGNQPFLFISRQI